MNSRARFTALAVLAIGFGAGTAAKPALADQCKYGAGVPSDNGPCMQFEHKTNRNNFDMYCRQGPTGSDHKIIMRINDSYTCQVKDMDAGVVTTNYNNNWKEWNYWCGGTSNDNLIGGPVTYNQKLVVQLTKSGGQGIWTQQCRTMGD